MTIEDGRSFVHFNIDTYTILIGVEVSAAVRNAMPESGSDRFQKRVSRRIQQRDDWQDRYLQHGWSGIFDEKWKSNISGAKSTSDADALSEILKVGTNLEVV